MVTQKPLVFYQQDQLIHGIRSTGKKIGKYKNKKYASMKYRLSRRATYGYIDEFLTGEFQSEIYAKITRKSVFLTSASSKTSKIIARDGADIFGLTKENRAKYSRKDLMPVAIKNIKQQILK
jgi:hypothetical protein